jgi:hypothetical protein
MFTLITWGRILLASLALAVFTPYMPAQSNRSPATTRQSEPATEATPAGDPEFGMLIIVGAIGFFILVAWIFSRTGDDGGRGPDRTLL